MAQRTLVGYSHSGRLTYWRDLDGYIYQFNEHSKLWQGWLCSLEAWERTYSKATWIDLIQDNNPEDIEADPVLLDDSVTEA